MITECFEPGLRHLRDDKLRLNLSLQKVIIAMALQLGSVCKSWRSEVNALFYEAAWEDGTIMHPQQCFDLVRSANLG